MSTTRGQPEPEPTPREQGERIARIIIAGHEQGAIRRIVLYALVSGLIIASLAVDGEAGLLIGGVALILLLLLAMTDDLA